MKNRFWEIDLLRGIAVIMMVVFHFIYDLVFLDKANFNLNSGFLLYFGRSVGAIFIFLVGISLTLSSQKFSNNFKRGLKIFVCGALITFVTWVFYKESVIIFGILHFIGISVIMGYFFANYKYLNLFLGGVLIFIGMLLKKFVFDFSFLLFLGFVPRNFYTLDYFPILPWFGVVLIGIFFGNLLYAKGRRKFHIIDINNYLIKSITFLGRHSLFIYLIHQPILIIILSYV